MSDKYYFYILECSDGGRYYGHTGNLKSRFNNHLRGRVYSTRDRRPLELAYYEEFGTCSEAFQREMQFKNGKTRKRTIDKLINSFPLAKCQGFNSHSDLCSLSLHKSRAH